VKTLLDKIRVFARLVRGGHGAGAVRTVLGRLYSRPVDLGLLRDLSIPVQAPPTRVEYTLRPLRDDDDLGFLEHGPPDESDDEAVLRLNQLRFVRAGIPTCYVAVTIDNQICCMQWIIAARDIPRLDAIFGPIYPPFAPDEALLEGAYTPVAFRGKGLMSAILTRVAAEGTALGAKRAYTYVAQDNIASLKGCKKAGFVPAIQRTYTFLFFHRFVSFRNLDPGTPYSFDAPAPATAQPAIQA
jgi:hypothetical protein